MESLSNISSLSFEEEAIEALILVQLRKPHPIKPGYLLFLSLPSPPIFSHLRARAAFSKCREEEEDMLIDPLQPLPVLWCAFSARKGWRDFSRLWHGMSKQQWTLLILRPHGVSGKEESLDAEGCG